MAHETVFGSNNFSSNATITAETENDIYPASNLSKLRLYPEYRSSSKALSVASSEYCTHPHIASMMPSTTFTFEIRYTPRDLSFQWLFHKLDSGAGNGFAIAQSADAIKVFFNGVSISAQTGSVLSIASESRVKVVYISASIYIYINGVQVSTTTTGTIPASIISNTLSVGIFASSGGASRLDAVIASIGLSLSAYNDATHLDPSLCSGYWNFDNNDLSDSSGNSNTLTGVGILPSNYIIDSSFVWIQLEFDQSRSPQMLVIDRRHNLKTGAKVRVWRQQIYTTISTNILAGEADVTEDTSIFLDLGAPTSSKWFFIEINNYDNEMEDILIPAIYMGDKSMLSVGYFSGPERDSGTNRIVVTLTDTGGGRTAYDTSGELNKWRYSYMLSASSDKLIMNSVLSSAQVSVPVSFTPDIDNSSESYLVYIDNAITAFYSEDNSGSYLITLDIQEIGGGFYGVE